MLDEALDGAAHVARRIGRAGVVADGRPAGAREPVEIDGHPGGRRGVRGDHDLERDRLVAQRDELRGLARRPYRVRGAGREGKGLRVLLDLLAVVDDPHGGRGERRDGHEYEAEQKAASGSLRGAHH